jgi:hypothetical protein
MTPYLQAWEAYHATAPDVPWDDFLTFFLHHGCLVNTPEVFICCRAVRVDLPDEAHNRFSPLQFTGEADCWNVWLAAGRLDFLLHLAGRNPLPWVSFNRRDEDRVRRVTLARFLRHEKAENAENRNSPATTATTAASKCHGQ